MSKLTYRAVLNQEEYGFIGFYKWYIYLRQCNQRPANCLECKQDFLPDQCVYLRHKGGRKGYICIPCAKNLILKYGPRGYHVTPLLNLQAADTMNGHYPAELVAGSIQAFTQSEDPNGATILTPFGEPHAQ